MNILLILGHPRSNSLCAALAAAYRTAALSRTMELRQLNLCELHFDPHVRTADFTQQDCEPDLLAARENLLWAQHIVLVYPLWWGSMPALLKGFLDRLLAPNFAFAARPDGKGFCGLLHGRSAHLLVTMDTPPTIYRWLLRAPGVTAMRRDVLGFCGIHPTEITLFGPVHHVHADVINGWLKQAANKGRLLPHTASLFSRGVSATGAWMRALRLQFYPMSWLAYTLGAGCASLSLPLQLAPYWWGYASLFFLEAATVFINDLVDAPSDHLNQHDGPFNGGSRVLVERRLTRVDLKNGVIGAVVASGLTFMVAAWMADLSPLTALVLIGISLVLCLGYTAPPLRFSYRGLGEIDVGITHGFLVILLGYILQGGQWSDSLPWLIALPLCLAIIPAIILANIPDRVADDQSGKGTLAVRLGNQGAAILACGVAFTAVAVTGVNSFLPQTLGLLNWLVWPALAHAVLLFWMAQRFIRRGSVDGRMDGLIALALAFIGWFLLIPAWHLFLR